MKIFNFKLSFLFLIFAFSFIHSAQAGVISDAPRFSQIGISVLNFLLSGFLILAIIMLLVSGIMYFFSAGNERMLRKAKRSSVYSIIGITIVAGAMIIIKTIGSIIGN